MIFYPAEIIDKKQKEWVTKNPERAAKEPEREVYLKPEFFEEEMEKMREQKAKQKMKEKDASKPEYPVQGPYGRAGRFNQSGTYAQYIMKNTIKNTMRDEDPREALLARAKEAAENPLFVGTAYKQTQPKPVFNYAESKQDNQKLLETKGPSKSCKHCGLKFCTCQSN